MRLMRFGDVGDESPGIELPSGERVDASAVTDAYDEVFFANGGLKELAQWLDRDGASAPRVDADVRIGPPIARPSKIVCIGLNFRDHAAETGAEPPKEPVLFFKSTTAIIGPNDDVVAPRGSTKLDWEVELAVVIGRTARYVAVDRAESCVAGYVLHNDYSERAFQLERGGQWVKGKSADTFAPIGPFLATTDEIRNPRQLGMWLTVNGETRQRSTTANMIFDVPALVSYVSQFMTLLPGDVISTGTPAGVGLGMKPEPKYLDVGDIVELGIDGLGRARQRIVAEKDSSLHLEGKRIMRTLRSCAAALLCLSSLACSGGSSSTTTIAVIPKGTSHAFWQSVHAGAVQAGQELNVTIAWRGPLREDERDSQISEVENAVARHVAGIVLAPLDESALVGPVESAISRNIPVVIFDSGLKSDKYVSFVATDNDEGGRLAGEQMVKLLNGRGRVALLRYAEGHDSTGRREEAFLAAVKQAPGIEVVSSNQYLGADVEGAYKRAEAILSQFVTPDRRLGIDGLFCVNESTAFATLRVLQDNGWAGKVHYIGFDASDNLIEGLSRGDLDGLVVQDPVRMGYLSVKTMVSHLRGEKVEKRIDTGVRVITRDIMNQPDVQQLLKPDLSKWLTQ